jgi:hypothetical protein
MLRLYETGLLNPALWAAAWLVVAVVRTGTVARPRGWTAVVAALLAAAAIGSFGIGLLKAYVAPRDVMQDIVSAREYRAGRAMYPPRMNELIREAINEEGGRPTGLGDTVEAEATRMRETGLSEHWVQAHPPTATLLVAPAEARFGVLGAQIAHAVASFLALLATGIMLARQFRPGWSSREYVLVGCLLLGWGSMTTVFRNGQWDTILLVLLTASWMFLRTDRPIWAGLFAGLAIGVKLFPTLILLVLLARHRRAFAVCLATVAVIVAACSALCHPGDFAAASTTMSETVDEYKEYVANLSAYGFLARIGHWMHWSARVTAAEWWAVAGFVGSGFAWLLWRGRHRPNPNGTDWAFAAAVAVMPLASPVAWDHYLVLAILPVAALASGVQTYAGRVLLAAACGLLAIPDATVLWLTDVARHHGDEGFAVWVVEPIRTYALVLIAGMAAARGIEPRTERDITP